MTIKFTLPSGQVIETDTLVEAERMAAILQLNSAQAQPNSPNIVPNHNQMIPSETDFIKAFQNPELKQVLRFIANQGNNGTIQKGNLQQNTGKQSLSGMGKLFRKLTGGVYLNSLIKIKANQNIYQVDQSAHRNLVEALKNNP
ncbi:MAG: hypothetical protein AAF915_15065 [Cyanobacteria bacterium P01_D01_bin.50]